MEEADKLDARAMTRIQGLIIDLKSRVVERLSSKLLTLDELDSWDMFWLPRLNSAIDNVVGELSRRAGNILANEFFPEAWRVGSAIFDAPFTAVRGFSLTTPVISPTLLGVLAPFSARLIKGIDEETRKAIDKSLKVNIALGESPHRAMKEIAQRIDTKGTPFRRVGARAEAIVRTEISRVSEMANEVRLSQAVREFPGLAEGESGLRQIFMSVQLGKWPCKVCQPYDGTVWEIDDPNKPRPPLHTSCRCYLAPFYPGISKVRTVPEPEAKKQRKASLVECGCCG